MTPPSSDRPDSSNISEPEPPQPPQAQQIAQKRAIAFLTLDIQRVKAAATELLEKLEAVRTGELDGWERLGNAYYLNLSGDRATIEDTVDDESPSCTLSIEEFAQLVQDWIINLKANETDENF
ncbi:hypothetical protein [Limnothrix redekei]|uniref:Uncharacterized protein n=1 Tax=Limnothrix redekei LRLZ20PSL1 TaxID=3112953 RepID=A0ABW7CA15_9CYAN